MQPADFGIGGQGPVNAPITNSAVNELPRDQAGVAGAIMGTSRQIGTNIAIALVGSVVFSVATHLDSARPVVNGSLSSVHGRANFIIGVRFGDLLAGVLALISVGVAAFACPSRTLPTVTESAPTEAG